MLMVLHFGKLAKMLNIETDFFYRNLKEDYMECPQGMSSMKKDDCVI